MPQAQQQEREGRCNGESAASQESARDSSHQNPALCASAAQQGGSASGEDEATSSPISRVCHYNLTCAVSLFTANVVIFSQMQNNLVVKQKKRICTTPCGKQLASGAQVVCPFIVFMMSQLECAFSG